MLTVRYVRRWRRKPSKHGKAGTPHPKHGFQHYAGPGRSR